MTRRALLFAFQTEMGSALHEAALFGKTDVVQILLAAGEAGSTDPMGQVVSETHACVWLELCDSVGPGTPDC